MDSLWSQEVVKKPPVKVLVVDGWRRRGKRNRNDDYSGSYMLKNTNNHVTTIEEGQDKDAESNYSTVEFL